jgi:phosphotransferase system IIB component
MKLKNIKNLDEKIKKYEGIDLLFENDNNSNQMTINTSNVQEEILNDEMMKGKSCNKNQKNESI